MREATVFFPVNRFISLSLDALFQLCSTDDPKVMYNAPVAKDIPADMRNTYFHC